MNETYLQHPDGTELERTFLFHLMAYMQEHPGSFPPHFRDYKWDDEERRSFEFDFSWPSLRIAVECEGIDHMAPATYAKDIYKYNMAASQGWIVLRCTTTMLSNNPTGFLIFVAKTIDIRRKELK